MKMLASFMFKWLKVVRVIVYLAWPKLKSHSFIEEREFIGLGQIET